ncbi:MAG: site-2 protease family protein [Epsilonproteobacteria bacterium]|nr:site-2 protease family protein [Campylobacterota bacterium]
MFLNALPLFVSSKIIPLFSAILGLSLLIAIHECGHFIFCKLFGIHTPTFSIGFGPELISKKIGDTSFRLALIPLGGYVEIAGLAEVGQGEQAHATVQDDTSFDKKPYWQKVLVLCGGIIFNMLLAYILFTTIFLLGTASKPSLTVASVSKDSAAESIGLRGGDHILSVDIIPAEDVKTEENVLSHHNFEEISATDLHSTQKSFIQSIQANPGKQIILHINRGDASLDLKGLIGSKPSQGKEIGVLGAMTSIPTPRLPFFQAVAMGIQVTNGWIKDIAYSVKQVITQRLEGAGGPVMIISHSFSSAQMGLQSFLMFLAIISINLALLNLLPIGALDGGQLLFATVEAVTRRKIPEIVKLSINLASWALFIGLFIYLTYKDVRLLFGGHLSKLYQKIVSLWS